MQSDKPNTTSCVGTSHRISTIITIVTIATCLVALPMVLFGGQAAGRVGSVLVLIVNCFSAGYYFPWRDE